MIQICKWGYDSGYEEALEESKEYWKENEIEEKDRPEDFIFQSCSNDAWDFMIDNLKEEIDKFDSYYWYCAGSGLGWRRRSGYKEFITDKADEFLNNILPTADCYFEIYLCDDDPYIDGNYIKIINSHHDASGEVYRIFNMPKDEYDFKRFIYDFGKDNLKEFLDNCWEILPRNLYYDNIDDIMELSLIEDVLYNINNKLKNDEIEFDNEEERERLKSDINKVEAAIEYIENHDL